MAPDAGGEAVDDDRAPDAEPTRDTGSSLVDRWAALDRGWQALALGLGIVAAHAAGQGAGVF